MGTRAEAEQVAAARSRVFAEYGQLVSLMRYETVLNSPLPEPAPKLKTVYLMAKEALSKTLRCLNKCTVTQASDLDKISDWLRQRHIALESAADAGTALPSDILLLGLVSCTTTCHFAETGRLTLVFVQTPLNLPLLLENFVCGILRLTAPCTDVLLSRACKYSYTTLNWQGNTSNGRGHSPRNPTRRAVGPGGSTING